MQTSTIHLTSLNCSRPLADDSETYLQSMFIDCVH